MQCWARHEGIGISSIGCKGKVWMVHYWQRSENGLMGQPQSSIILLQIQLTWRTWLKRLQVSYGVDGPLNLSYTVFNFLQIILRSWEPDFADSNTTWAAEVACINLRYVWDKLPWYIAICTDTLQSCSERSTRVQTSSEMRTVADSIHRMTAHGTKARGKAKA